jgi:hypothetical protein
MKPSHPQTSIHGLFPDSSIHRSNRVSRKATYVVWIEHKDNTWVEIDVDNSYEGMLAAEKYIRENTVRAVSVRHVYFDGITTLLKMYNTYGARLNAAGPHKTSD